MCTIDTSMYVVVKTRVLIQYTRGKGSRLLYINWMARGKKEIKQKKIKAIQENGVVSNKTYPINTIKMTLFFSFLLFCTTFESGKENNVFVILILGQI